MLRNIRFPSRAAFVEYLTSYVSAFIITGIEIAAVYYFVRKYDLGKTKRLFIFSVIAGALGFIAYIVGETLAFLGKHGKYKCPSAQDYRSRNISRRSSDYGNALVIFLSIFSLVMILGVLFRINPPRIQKGNLQNRTGFRGWHLDFDYHDICGCDMLRSTSRGDLGGQPDPCDLFH